MNMMSFPKKAKYYLAGVGMNAKNFWNLALLINNYMTYTHPLDHHKENPVARNLMVDDAYQIFQEICEEENK